MYPSLNCCMQRVLHATSTETHHLQRFLVHWPRPVQCSSVLVSDLNHFLDLSDGAPAPARRLARQLGDIVRAATAGDARDGWASALPCWRRPARRPCAGRIIVARHQPPAPIQWRCSVCDDEGVISNWADSPYDLRRRRLTAVAPVHEVVLAEEVAAALRELVLLDPDCQRLVYGMRAHKRGAILAATEDDLEELIGFVAAEANHEPNRHRQRRLDAAFDSLSTAAQTLNGR